MCNDYVFNITLDTEQSKRQFNCQQTMTSLGDPNGGPPPGFDMENWKQCLGSCSCGKWQPLDQFLGSNNRLNAKCVTCRLPITATGFERIRLLEATKAITGLSEYMSALKDNLRSAQILAPVVVSCIDGSKIRNEAGTRTRMITLEDLISLLPSRYCAQPPTLKIIELYITQQILFGYGKMLGRLGIQSSSF
jgi:hypothetical protein